MTVKHKTETVMSRRILIVTNDSTVFIDDISLSFTTRNTKLRIVHIIRAILLRCLLTEELQQILFVRMFRIDIGESFMMATTCRNNRTSAVHTLGSKIKVIG